LLDVLAGNPFDERASPGRILAHQHLMTFCFNVGLRAEHRQLQPARVDSIKHIALVNPLIIADRHAAHRPGNIRRNLHHIGPTRPSRVQGVCAYCFQKINATKIATATAINVSA
jgi:hypothetical protein